MLSKRVEDLLILLLRNDYQKGYVLNRAVTYQGHEELEFIDNVRRRHWRRFVRMYLEPVLDEERRILEITKRWKEVGLRFKV